MPRCFCRLPVVQQDDQVSCGLFVLFYCCFIVRNSMTWKTTIGAATFRLQDMREWLAVLKVDGAHAAFTLDQLPAFVPSEASRRSETALVAGYTDDAGAIAHNEAVLPTHALTEPRAGL